MNNPEKIQLIKTEVREKTLARVKKTSLNYQMDETVVRRHIESLIDTAAHAVLEGPLDNSVRRFIVEEVVNDIFGYGPVDRLMRDETISEIMVNGPKEVYVEREGRLQKTEVVFEDEEQLAFYIDRILSPSGRHISESEPYIDARLPDGSRINVVRSPVAPYGPILTIRKAGHRVLNILDLVARRTLDQNVAQFLKACVKNHLNIVIAGGPGSGKTTILNILASYIHDTERVITIEDTLELRMEGKHRVALETRPPNIEGKGEITIRDLVRNALHMRPDRLIIGEVRGGEALDMLQSMNIGRVGSMTTLHANSSLDALLRLETMSLLGSVQISMELIRRQIVSAVDLVIMIDRFPDGSRRVMAVSEVQKGYDGTYNIKDIYAIVRRQEGDQTFFDLKPTGHRPAFLDKFLESEMLPAEFKK